MSPNSAIPLGEGRRCLGQAYAPQNSNIAKYEIMVPVAAAPVGKLGPVHVSHPAAHSVMNYAATVPLRKLRTKPGCDSGGGWRDVAKPTLHIYATIRQCAVVSCV